MRIPMFPLGSVLFPGGILPLQVFEPRYRELVTDVTATDRRFGVVLIKRGSEVGGGDERNDIGTVAEIVRMGEAEDGRVLITAVGKERIRVEQWRIDDPYPCADVEFLPELDPEAGLAVALEAASAARRRLLALAIAMGADGQHREINLPDDLKRAAWALCSAAPIGSYDRQRLLVIDDAASRLQLVEQIMLEQTRDLEDALRRR